ncbi:MAG: TetR family transcriptional regulator C-terminal domain-containing protein [Acidobacteria bacterium]|nr:TetR family transcriptional regulator C-terminal domain-containing protein [Acidobacteriota bacterium]
MKAKSTRGETTRLRILESAAKLIYRNGVNGTSVDDVLTASGTGKSQFYHYFISKDALVREVVTFQLATMPSVQEERLKTLTSLAGIDAWLDGILADYESGRYDEGCPIGNLASEMAGQDEALRTDLQAIFARWETFLTAGLKEMLGKGELRPGSAPEALAMFCVATIEGALLLAKTKKSAAPLATSLAQLKQHLRGQAPVQRAGASKAAATQGRRPGPLSYCP